EGDRHVQRDAVHPGREPARRVVARPGAPQLHGDLLGQVVAVLGRARVGAGDLEHDAAVLLQKLTEGLAVVRGHGGAGLHPWSWSVGRLCPSWTWFAEGPGLSHGPIAGASRGHSSYSTIRFDSAVASTSGWPVRRRGPNSGYASTAARMIATPR